jgi:hypothetical protein
VGEIVRAELDRRFGRADAQQGNDERSSSTGPPAQRPGGPSPREPL